MEIDTVSNASLKGLDFERSRLETAMFRIAISNAQFSRESQVVDFLATVGAQYAVDQTDVSELKNQIRAVYEPDNPLAGKDGFIYQVKVDPTHEMASLVSASRAYEANIRAYNTQAEMIRSALKMGEI